MPVAQTVFKNPNAVGLRRQFSPIICLFFLLLLVSGCATETGSTETDSLFFGNILDEEELFDAETEDKLSRLIDSLEVKTGIDFVLATVSDPGAEGLIGYAAAMTKKISPGHPGMNNGAIIYLSDNRREVKVECGYGMEWYVSDTAAGFVIEHMRPFLVEGDYVGAARTGFLEIANLASSQDWQIDLLQWTGDTLQELTPGMILQIEGNGIARAYQEGVPEATQFHSNYFIDVIHQGQGVRIYFSGYMRDIVDQIVYSEEPVEISCLVLETEPLRLGLIGIE